MRRLRQNVGNLQMAYIIEYRYRLELGQQWTEWKEHHTTDSVEEAGREMHYLEQMEGEDRAEGLLSRWEETQYRVVGVVK